MKQYQNEGSTDRLIRLFVAEVLIIGAYFWIGGMWQIILYVLGFVSLFTSFTGFCALYKIFGVNTLSSEPKEKALYVKIIIFLLFLIVAVAGSYYSAFFTKKFFLDDYTKMNNYYKQTLFYTGQGNRPEAILNYDNLVSEYNIFIKKYSAYHPYALKSDSQFNSDLIKVSDIIVSLNDGVYTGDLVQTHLSFELVRPIFQDLLKRNNFSLFAVALVDFHDAMEKIIEAADAKDPDQLLNIYAEVDSKLKEVEAIINDLEIQEIRSKLEEVVTLAKDGQNDLLSSKAAELKSSFVKVYLKKG